MRRLVWSVLVSALACGRSISYSDPRELRGHGGTKASGESGHTAMPGAMGGGTPRGGAGGQGGRATGGLEAGMSGAPTGGRTEGGGPGDAARAGNPAGNGGAAQPAAGSGGAPLGGGPASTGGTFAGGGADDAGAGGSPAETCAGEYLACGCGCCTDAQNSTCYYPDNGDSLAQIESADRVAAMSPSCENAGCSIGKHYWCCVVPPADDTGTYEVTYRVGDLDRLTIKRTGVEGSCGFLGLVQGGSRISSLPLTLPEPWGLETASGYTCNLEDGRGAMGAIGFVSLAADGCTVDFDVTLFLLPLLGSVQAVRFKAAGVPVPGHGAPACP